MAVENNVMRDTYRELSDVDKENMTAIKHLGLHFYDRVDQLGTSRELSIAKTKIEEAVMWATKHITR